MRVNPAKAARQTGRRPMVTSDRRSTDYDRAIDRLGARIVVDSKGCWVVPGDPAKYPRLHIATDELGANAEQAHRFVYELVVGRIPSNCVLHHTCENKRCVNPRHLKPLTTKGHAEEHSRLKAS